MPVFHATSSSATTGHEAGRLESTAVSLDQKPSRSDSWGFFSVQTTIPVDESRKWEPLPTDDRNRPGPEGTLTIVQPYATSASDPLLSSSGSTQGGSMSAAELAGITVSAGVVAFTVLFAIIWWMKRRRSRIGHGGSFAVIEKAEEPPTYEAAVFGVDRDTQSVRGVPSGSPPPPSDPQPTLQSPPAIHHIHSPRPFNAASSNRTLHQLDLDPITPGENTFHEPINIVIYPHDSPPPSERSTLSIRSALQMDPDRESDAVSSSYHITDFTEEYPSVMPVDDDMNDGEAVAREII